MQVVGLGHDPKRGELSVAEPRPEHCSVPRLFIAPLVMGQTGSPTGKHRAIIKMQNINRKDASTHL